jgi:hypothetical protein
MTGVRNKEFHKLAVDGRNYLAGSSDVKNIVWRYEKNFATLGLIEPLQQSQERKML